MSKTARKVRASHVVTAQRPVKTAGFTLQQTTRFHVALRMQMSLMLLGLGTTGTSIVDQIVRLVLQEFGRLPLSLGYLTIDTRDGNETLDPLKHRRLGLNGAGTDPRAGRDSFLREYESLFFAANQSILGLRPDPEAQMLIPAGEAVTFVCICGNGGSSGGMQEPAMMLCHDVGRERRIRTTRVNRVFLGAEMPIHDANRTVSVEQRQTIQQTAACNLTKVLADHASPELARMTPPARPHFSIPACDATWGLYLQDYSNGQFQCGTTAEFTALMARALFLMLFTHAGQSAEDRLIDLEALGTIGRGMWLP